MLVVHVISILINDCTGSLPIQQLNRIASRTDLDTFLDISQCMQFAAPRGLVDWVIKSFVPIKRQVQEVFTQRHNWDRSVASWSGLVLNDREYLPKRADKLTVTLKLNVYASTMLRMVNLVIRHAYTNICCFTYLFGS